MVQCWQGCFSSLSLWECHCKACYLLMEAFAHEAYHGQHCSVSLQHAARTLYSFLIPEERVYSLIPEERAYSLLGYWGGGRGHTWQHSETMVFSGFSGCTNQPWLNVGSLHECAFYIPVLGIIVDYLPHSSHTEYSYPYSSTPQDFIP